ncbi:MAG TPA: hypothetical protein VLJ60_04755, partial [bacterium]|nr:hypothetical protein [bacterium]
MKRIFILTIMVAFTLIMVSCDKEKKPRTDDINDEDIIEVDTETDDDQVIETDDDPVVPDEDICTLNQDWLAPDSAWAAWGYLRMSGGVGEYQGDYVEATFTEGKMKIAKGTTDLEYGSYMNYQGTTLLADAVAYEFLNVNQTAGTALIDYYDAMWQFNAQIIPLFKEDGVREVDFASFVWFRHTFIDVNFNASGQVTEQRVRKNCWYALGATEEVEEEGETYDVPIGGIYGCFDENVDGSVGETLKMMFRNKMTDDRADILAFINTLEDGTVLEYGDEGFKFECECYTELGATDVAGENEVACWQYDGPGEGEECPAEVEAAGKCDEGAADDDIVDEDIVDENIIDEDPTDNDPYVDPCLPTNPCVEANKTVCTDADEDGVEECACVATYHLEEAACVSNTKNVDCTDNAPENATSTIVPVEVTWNGTIWSTPVDCVWDCDVTFHTEDNTTCVSDTQQVICDSDGVTAPVNGHVVDDAYVTVTWGGANWSAPAKCAWACNATYHTEDNTTCVSDTKQVDCTDVAPANATSTIVPVEVTWSGTIWSTPVDCVWDCDVTFHSENGTTCVSDTKQVDCTDDAPANATSTIVPVEVTWNGSVWSAPADCDWDCDDNFVINGTADGCEPDPCDANPCSGGTPVCLADATPQGYTCYPDYNVEWCIVQFPKSVEGALVGDKVDLYSRVYIPGITTVTADAIDLHPLLKVQFGGAPAGTPVAEWEADTWIDAAPNTGYGNDDEYMVLNHSLDMAGEFDYTFRYSVDAGQTWTVCDTEGNMPYDPEKLGFASVNRIFAKWPLDTDFVADGSATVVDDAVEVTNFVGGSGIGAITWGTSGAYANGWSTGALDLNDYFQ